MFQQCTIVLYDDMPEVKAATAITECEFNDCCFVGDKASVNRLLSEANKPVA